MGNNRVLVGSPYPAAMAPLCTALGAKGFEVTALPLGEVEPDAIRRLRPLLVVLHIERLDERSRAICAERLAGSGPPVILVVSREQELDPVAALESGADDVVVIPVDRQVFVARALALLRRTALPEPSASLIGTERMSLNRDGYCVRARGRWVSLTPHERDLLVFLMEHADQTWTREQLVDHAYGMESNVCERNIDQHIKNLRKKIEFDPHHPSLIRTVHRVGYKFVTDRETNGGRRKSASRR
jgi:DNA-binding response OmpR family regulator